MIENTKRDWFFCMGMLDSYDYLKGKHPSQSDDSTTTEWWTRRTVEVVRRYYTHRNRNPMNIT